MTWEQAAPAQFMLLRQGPTCGPLRFEGCDWPMPSSQPQCIVVVPECHSTKHHRKIWNLEKMKTQWQRGASDDSPRFISRSKLRCTGGRIDPGPSVPRSWRASALVWRQHIRAT